MRNKSTAVIAGSVVLLAAIGMGNVHATDHPRSLIHAAAKAKIGGACTAPGKIITIGGVRAKCALRGSPGKKRLIWVRVRGNPTPSPSPTPTPNPTPTPTPNPAPERPTALSSLYSTAWTWAYADVADRLTAMTLAPVALDVRRTDNFPAELAERMLAGYDRIGSFWSDVASPQQPIIVRMGTEKDLDWWRSELGRFGPMYDAIASMYASAGAYANSANSYTQGAQFHHQFAFGTLIPVEAQRHATNVTVPHEFTHSIQAAAGGGLNALPCWFIEGQANVYGVAVGQQPRRIALPSASGPYAGSCLGPERGLRRTPSPSRMLYGSRNHPMATCALGAVTRSACWRSKRSSSSTVTPKSIAS